MKRFLLLCFFYFSFVVCNAQYVNIADSSFKANLKLKYPTCFNASGLLDTTCSSIINANELNISLKGISTLNGIQFFKNLKSLDCSNNTLQVLPNLPNSITNLFCSNNLLSTIPVLPSSIKYLELQFNKLTSLPVLPSTLELIYCDNNKLSTLPSLPASLKYLNCGVNKLNSLPTLPNSLTEFTCSFNEITSIPNIPNNLVYLFCDNNKLSTLPSLSNSVELIACSFNNIAILPTLPNSLLQLYCNDNLLNCLPTLTTSLTILILANNSIQCIPNQLDSNAFIDLSLPLCTDPSDICTVLTSTKSNKNNNYKFFPNPATTSINVELPDNINYKWYLTDLAGKIIKQNNYSQSANNFIIDVSDIPSGAYLLSLHFANTISTSEIVVIH